MNWPDAGLERARKRIRIRQQNTGGESNPAHFSVIRISGSAPGYHSEHGFALPCIGEMPVKTASCPLSVQRGGKLMHKIHRLTDN
jgi:hypothetical protein